MENNRAIEFECSCVVGDELWFSARDFNGLFKGNLKNGQVNFVAFFPDESLFVVRMHGNIIRHENKLYCIPGEARHFHVYDLKTGQIESCKIERAISSKSYSPYINAGNLYFIPNKVQEWLVVNLENQQITYRKLPLKDSLQKSIVCKENRAYATLENSNVLVEIDLERNTVQQMSIDESHNQYLLLGMRKDILYLKNNNGQEILMWDVCAEKVTARHIVKTSIVTDALQFGDRVMVNTYSGNGVQELDLAKVICRVHRKEMDETKEIPLSAYELLNMFIYQDEIWYVWGGDGAIYNEKNHKCLVKFTMSDEVVEQMREKTVICKGMEFREMKFFSVAEYVKWLEKNADN